MVLDYLISAFVTLLVVVDPVSIAPVFAALTRGLAAEARRQIAVNACLIAAGILISFATIGDWVLSQLGITLPALRIAGGLLLFAVAFDMVLGWRGEREGKAAVEAVQEEHIRHIAAFPLAIPLMAGPGAITAALLLAARAHERALYILILLGVIAAVLTTCFVAFLFAARISRLLGTTGNVVFSRVLGIILAALSVQYVIDGMIAAVKN